MTHQFPEPSVSPSAMIKAARKRVWQWCCGVSISSSKHFSWQLHDHWARQLDTKIIWGRWSVHCQGIELPNETCETGRRNHLMSALRQPCLLLWFEGFSCIALGWHWIWCTSKCWQILLGHGHFSFHKKSSPGWGSFKLVHHGGHLDLRYHLPRCRNAYGIQKTIHSAYSAINLMTKL